MQLRATTALTIRVFVTSSEGVVNATEGSLPDIGLSIVGFSYGSVTVMVSILTYSEYAARGYSLENDFDPDMIPTSAADSGFLTSYQEHL